MLSSRFLLGLRVALGVAGAVLVAMPSHAVPSFARQTGQECAACHIGSYGPQLTPYGTRFKIGGYTDTDGKEGKVPLSGMVVASFTHTAKKQDPAPEHASKNDNFAMDEASVFLAGRISEKLGAFVQVTYDGIAGTTALDQMDLRFAHATELQGKELTVGLSVNNNPGVQDPFNTMPVWGFPYVGSALGFGGAETGTLINGGLEQRVLGLSAYAFYDKNWYAELGTYRSLSTWTQWKMGLGKADDPGKLGAGSAYWRVAYMKDLKSSAWSVGLFGLNSSVQPDRSSGSPSNNYNDIGVDAQYQFLGTREHVFTAQTSFIRERQKRNALTLAGEADHNVGHLNEFKLNASYHFQQTYGASVGYFSTTGTSDSLVYADNRRSRPNTAGVVMQLDWTPFGKEDSWGSPWANVRLGAQYTAYSKYNGASSNYDGSGRKASDNDTLFLFAWTSF